MAEHNFKRILNSMQSGLSSVQATWQKTHGSSTFYSSELKSKCMKSGWLKKQGGVMKSWQRRWFTIKGDHMYYFATDDETRPHLGLIFLPGNGVVEHPFNSNEPEKFLFEIMPGSNKNRMTPSHETYPLWAADDDDRKAWVGAIKRVIYASRGGAIFGQELDVTMRFESRQLSRKVPQIVQQCVEFITEEGLEMEGLFRLPGRAALIRKLRNDFDCAECPDFTNEEVDVHTVASLLKAYLRELPTPLVPLPFYEPVSKLVNRELPVNVHEALENLAHLLTQMPHYNYNLMQYLCRFLQQVSNNSDVNKMTDMNLATIFNQSFMRPESEDPALLMGTASNRAQVVFVLISQCQFVFKMEYTADGQPVMVDNLLDIDQSRAEPAFDPQADSLYSVSHSASYDNDLLDSDIACSKSLDSLPKPLQALAPPDNVVPHDTSHDQGQRSQLDSVYRHRSQSSPEKALCHNQVDNRSQPADVSEPQDQDSSTESRQVLHRSRGSMKARGQVLIDGSFYDESGEMNQLCDSGGDETDTKKTHERRRSGPSNPGNSDLCFPNGTAVSPAEVKLRDSLKPGSTRSLPPRPAPRVKSRRSMDMSVVKPANGGAVKATEAVVTMIVDDSATMATETGAPMATACTNGELSKKKDSPPTPRIPPRPIQPGSSNASLDTVDSAGGAVTTATDDADQNFESLITKDLQDCSEDDLLVHISNLCEELRSQRSKVKELTSTMKNLRERNRGHIERMAEKLDMERNATAGAVDRVVKLQAELQQYTMKHGQLE